MARITVKNLMEIKDVSEETAKECMTVLQSGEDTLVEKYSDLFRNFYNMPMAYECKMIVLDKLLGGYGVEAFEHRGVVYTYINMGDSYALTVVFSGRKGNFTLNSWGDIAER